MLSTIHHPVVIAVTAERPLEVIQLAAHLHLVFDELVPEAPMGTAEERERNRLSRALAAYAIETLGKATRQEAAKSIVDGGGDGGIDAVYFSRTSSTLWVVQSKYLNGGRGQPQLGDVAKFKLGLENLLQGKFDAFSGNAEWSARLPEIQRILDGDAIQVRGVLVYSGEDVVGEDRRSMFDDLRRRFSGDSDFLEIQPCNLTTVHGWLTGADATLGIPEVDLIVLHPGSVSRPFETLYGQIPLYVVADLYREHGNRLVEANIRAYKGTTDVNNRIAATAQEEPEHFFYLNNGLTAYCERFRIHNADRANTASKRVHCTGFSIINGAQTVGAVARSIQRGETPEGFVFLRLVSLERCDDERAFASRITQSTNFQNQITARDFVALDAEQERIAAELALSNVAYHYKDSDDTQPSDANNFTLGEATTACACLVQKHDCDFVVRLLVNRRSLWEMGDLRDGNPALPSRYSRVFRPDRSARVIWRAVQAQRVVIALMQSNTGSSTGPRKAFYENARWFILNVVFLRLHPERGEALTLSDAEVESITRETIEIAEQLWDVCRARGYVVDQASTTAGDGAQQVRHFRSVFGTAADCQILRRALLAQLAQHPASSPGRA